MIGNVNGMFSSIAAMFFVCLYGLEQEMQKLRFQFFLSQSGRRSKKEASWRRYFVHVSKQIGYSDGFSLGVLILITYDVYHRKVNYLKFC